MTTHRRWALGLALLVASCGQAYSPGGSARPTVGTVQCGAYQPPDPNVSAEIQHLKTSATVIEVLSPCTLRVRIAGGAGTLAAFGGKTIVLRAMASTTFATAPQGDLGAIGHLGLAPQDVFTLSFDSRAFPDGSYPLNFMNR